MRLIADYSKMNLKKSTVHALSDSEQKTFHRIRGNIVTAGDNPSSRYVLLHQVLNSSEFSFEMKTALVLNHFYVDDADIWAFTYLKDEVLASTIFQAQLSEELIDILLRNPHVGTDIMLFFLTHEPGDHIAHKQMFLEKILEQNKVDYALALDILSFNPVELNLGQVIEIVRNKLSLSDDFPDSWIIRMAKGETDD